ncbi:hypothetical protein K0017_05175 [Staphylococcus massiliensis]|uniref:SA1788 family PVL leukocidin-associated protein n=1 Tax=Staphylococcus massiliensis TaxID=555791 RepID=UPI001EE0BC32|nr:SA1788 family PVL leukocidin-associated protein [Staphylococcus massiliensis]MCG3401711.1 hypothetical protein [Staphylococcus massiliensis]
MITIFEQDKKLNFNEAEVNYMESNQVTEDEIRQRMNAGWFKDDIVSIPGYRLTEHFYNDAEEKARSRRVARALKKERFKQEHPWLFDGTPQYVEAGKWYYYLLKNDIYPKVVGVSDWSNWKPLNEVKV